MATQVYTFKITYEGCNNKIWRTFEVSSNYDLAQLGYMVLSSFQTNAYHLFSIEHKGTVYVTGIEDYSESPQLREVKLSRLKLQVGEHMTMIYDFGCEQNFDIEFLGFEDMPKGSGRAYPKVVEGEGRGIIDDMPVDELMEIIKATDKNGKSDFKIITEFGDELIWDYRDYSRDFDNSLLKGEIQRIREGYESEEY